MSLFLAGYPDIRILLLEDTLFLGGSYEQLFDRFECFFALVYADLEERKFNFWGPPGRFAWKYRSRFGSDRNNPFADLCAEAAQRGDGWVPLKAGLFRGSYERFKEVSTRFEIEILKKLQSF